MKNNLKALLLLPILFTLIGCGGSQPTSSVAPSSAAPESSVLPSSESSLIPSSEEPSSEPEHRAIEVIERPVAELDDNYLNVYQIFPISFADSNGDGWGDLQGIIDKLDHIKEMNFNAIWICPIHPTNSYHHYDVKDYYNIDPLFGNLNTYDRLVEACHERGIKILLDLVINHSSSSHQWLERCVQAHINNDPTNQYYNYYELNNEGKGHRYKNTNWYYQSSFTGDMADFYLESVVSGENENLANELKNIFKFWIVDHDIDGFRLDACSWLCKKNEDSITFLSWLNDEVKALKEDAYIVGECWVASSIYSKYYQSGVDSFFSFDTSLMGNNYIGVGTNVHNVTNIDGFYKNVINTSKGGISGTFITNHDMKRASGLNESRNKMMHNILSTGNGAVFEYYGEEIGMRVAESGSNDEDYRQPLNWGDSYTCTPVPNSAEGTKYPFGSVKDQLENPDSILNHFKKIYRYRLENPELARADEYEMVLKAGKGNYFGLFRKTYNDSTVYIAMNLSNKDSYEFDMSEYMDLKIVADLSCEESPYWSGDNVLTFPPMSMIYLH